MLVVLVLVLLPQRVVWSFSTRVGGRVVGRAEAGASLVRSADGARWSVRSAVTKVSAGKAEDNRSARAQSSRVSAKTAAKGGRTARRLTAIDGSRRLSPMIESDKPCEQCGFCGGRFETRLALFRHLRDEGSCREAALAELPAMPLPASRRARATEGDERRQQLKEDAAKEVARRGAARGGDKGGAQRCGYCGERFSTRSKLFRHLRENNACHKLAISHGMPVENPYRVKDRRLRRIYGDVLLSGCIVLYRKRGRPVERIAEGSGGNGLIFRDDRLMAQYEVVLVRNAGGRGGFPKGKIELSDASYLDAALRETWEEAGLRASQLYVLPEWVALAVGRHQGEDVQDDAAEDSYEIEDDDIAEADLEDDDEPLDDDLDLADDRHQQPVWGGLGLPSPVASIDVREITGKYGKRAKYFVCAVVDAPPRPGNVTAAALDPPRDSRSVALTNRNDVDRDIDEVEWLPAREAMKLLGSKRRTALRRALTYYELFFQNRANHARSDPP